MARRCSHKCKKHCDTKSKSSKRGRTRGRGRGRARTRRHRGGALNPLSPSSV